MKRKSGQHRQDKRKQARSDESSGPVIRDGASFTQLELAPGQSVTFTGSAVLEVAAGCLAVYGALVTPEMGPLRLHAPTKFGRALQLAAVAAADVEPPCQPSSTPVQAVLQPLEGSQQQQQQQQSYSVTAAAAEDAAPAWQVPEPWAQAVADLTAAAAAAAAAAAGNPAISGHRPLSVAVSGSKGSGKSAFARLLVNSLLSQGHGVVAYLDLDPGQPEFTPPGLLSLQLLHQPVFGPSHLQHQHPLLAFFQGDTSSQSEPGRYLQAVQALVQHYSHLNAADLTPAAAAAAAAVAEPLQVLPPLVINTPGWITGLGLDLLAEVLRCAAPTHVVQLQTANPKKNLPAATWWMDNTAAAGAAGGCDMPVLLQVPSVSGAGAAEGGSAAASAAAAAAADSMMSAPSGDTTQTASGKNSSVKGVSAATARNLTWLAWTERVAAANPPTAAAAAAGRKGRSREAPQEAAAAVDGPNAAAAVAAAAEDFSGVAAALAAAAPMVVSLEDIQVEALHAQVSPAELPIALNGAVVGLASSSSSSSSRQGLRNPSQSQQGSLHECLGLGLVRAVDGPGKQLYLLTDLSEQQLQRVDLLQLGKLELPDKLLECKSFASPYQGLFCLSSTATGAGQIKSRNNLLRSSQLLR